MSKRDDVSKAMGQRLALAQESADEGWWDWDIRRGKLVWSDQLYNLFGINKKETASFETWRRVLHPEDRTRAEEKINQAIKSKIPLSNEYRVVCPGNKTRWISALGKTVYDARGVPVRMSGICLDITERKTLETQLKEKSQELQNILDAVPAMVFYKDKENRFVKVNRAFSEAMKMKSKDLEGKYLHDLYPKKLAKKYWQDDLEVIARGKPKRNILEPMMTVDGERRVRTDKIPFLNKNGETVGVIGFALDVTEKEELEERKNVFISIAGHELKTPIAGIKIYINLIQKLLKEKDLGSIDQHLDKINSQVKKMADLTNDLLDVSKIQSGKLTLRKEKFILSELVQETVEVYRKIANRYHLVYKNKGEDWVWADRDRLGQVIINLLSNAVKYSDEGSRIVVKIENLESEVVVSVKDQGIGIDKKDKQKIFESFYRVYDKRKEYLPGLGIGLYVAGEIVKQHKGKIWFTSRKGKGTTFYFKLPRLVSRGMKRKRTSAKGR